MAKIEKNKLIEKVKELEGLSNDEKAALIGFIKTKTYGLVWEDSTEKVWEQLKDYIPVLTEDKTKAIVNDTNEQKNPNHILIEGDNLLALTNLCFTHEGKVDVIYIDPPYNTGNNDFVYNDSFVDTEDSYRHSKWLSFMEKRLKIARNLLSEEGVIFISIDNNEFANLKLLCDEIFKENNFVEVLKWKRKKQPSFLARHTAPVMEYVLIYAKDYYKLDKLSIEGASDKTKKVLNISNGESERHFIKGIRIKIAGSGCKRAGRYTNKTLSIELKQDLYYENGRTCNDVDVIGRFTDSQERIDDFIKNDLLFFTSNFGLRRDVSDEDKGKRKSITDLLLDWGDNQDSEQEQKMILGKRVFDYAKPTKLIYNLIKSFNSDETLVLDFFAGSGTTLQSTMQLNADDGGVRQCVLVTNNENGICENVTYERNLRVINGYMTPEDKMIPGLKDNNLRYFKVGFVPREKDLTNIERFARQSVNLLCIKEDVYKEQTMFGELETEGFRYFKDGDKQFLVILEPDMIEPIIEEITKMDYEGKMPVYVFTTGNYPYTEDFWQVSEKVDLYPYPTCVYGACEKVMPKVEDKLLDLPDDVELSDEEANMTFEDLNKE